MATLTIQTYSSPRNAREAIAYADGWEDLDAILLDGRPLVVDADTADHLAERGVAFAYVGLHAGRVVTVPMN